MSKEVAMKKLLQACSENPELLTRLIEKPQEVAKEYDVALEPAELQQLQRVKKLKDLVEEFKLGRVIGPPAGYPADVMWKTTLANHILFYKPIFYPLFYMPIFYRWGWGSYPIFYQIFYPIGYYYATGQVQQARRFSGLRSLGKKRT